MLRRSGFVVFACLSALFLSAGSPPEIAPAAEAAKGSCDWYCDSDAYRTAACDLACDTPCERICW